MLDYESTPESIIIKNKEGLYDNIITQTKNKMLQII